jgi:hypothetical protein
MRAAPERASGRINRAAGAGGGQWVVDSGARPGDAQSLMGRLSSGPEVGLGRRFEREPSDSESQPCIPH